MTEQRSWRAVGPDNEADAETTHAANTHDYERQLARLVALLQPGEQGARLVTLVGRSGRGKMDLAAGAIRQLTIVYGGAVFSVCPAQAVVPIQLLVCILDVVQTQPRHDWHLWGNSGPAATDVARIQRDLDAWLEYVVRALPASPCLLVLDRFEKLLLDGHPPYVGNEQALPDGASIIGTLLAHAPQLKCLVISRRLLDLEGEFAFPLFRSCVLDPLDATPRSLYTRFYG